MSGFGTRPAYRPPRDCPVCGHDLTVTRVGCGACGTELSGIFEACAFCALTDADRELLRVFLVSRGNLREVERHLGVSYPTARQRYADLLVRLGLESADPPTGESVAADVGDGAQNAVTTPAGAVKASGAAAVGADAATATGSTQARSGEAGSASRDEILSRLANGDLDVEAAAEQLRQA